MESVVDGGQLVEFCLLYVGCRCLRGRNEEVKEVEFCWFVHERAKDKRDFQWPIKRGWQRCWRTGHVLEAHQDQNMTPAVTDKPIQILLCLLV